MKRAKKSRVKGVRLPMEAIHKIEQKVEVIGTTFSQFVRQAVLTRLAQKEERE